MKSRTHGAETTWTLKGDTITVFIPMTWKRRGGQKVIIAPEQKSAFDRPSVPGACFPAPSGEPGGRPLPATGAR